MISWWWLIPGYYAGALSALVVVAFFVGAYRETERCVEESEQG